MCVCVLGVYVRIGVRVRVCVCACGNKLLIKIRSESVTFSQEELFSNFRENICFESLHDFKFSNFGICSLTFNLTITEH